MVRWWFLLFTQGIEAHVRLKSPLGKWWDQELNGSVFFLSPYPALHWIISVAALLLCRCRIPLVPRASYLVNICLLPGQQQLGPSAPSFIIMTYSFLRIPCGLVKLST